MENYGLDPETHTCNNCKIYFFIVKLMLHYDFNF